MSITIATTETLSHFAQHADEVAARVKKSGQPVVLTVDGEEELVVQDVRSYRLLLQRADEAEVHAVLERSITADDAGQVVPAFEALTELARRHGLSIPV
jgi:PHD/YefM family antitoxin component YafN of YafNO toxin-antitoxin module